MKLARDQAESQATRLRARLEELFGQAGADLSSVPPGGRGGASSRAGGSAASGVVSAKEAELMSTVANLKTALEKATAGSVPTTKYMAVSRERGAPIFELWGAELDHPDVPIPVKVPSP